MEAAGVAPVSPTRRRRARQRTFPAKMRSGEKRSIPRRRGCRGGLGGEVVCRRASWCSGNLSPELRMAAACFGRRRIVRSGAKKNQGPCQNDAQMENRENGGGGEVRGARSSPEMVVNGGGRGGLRRWILPSLGAIGREEVGALVEDREGFKRRTVVLPLALA